MCIRYEILRLLMEDGGFISGSDIGKKFNMTRAAVWKHIDRLKKEGYIIRSVENRGYCYMGRTDIINGEELKRQLKTDFTGKELYYYRSVGSTNDKAKELAEEGCSDGTVVIAEEQFKGRGRRGRSWNSETGSAVAVSILLRPGFPPEYAPNLTLILGMAVNKTVRALGCESFIKWPNDIVAGGRKLCGILVEMATEEREIKYVVCGVGINVSNKDFPDEIKETATSVFIETGKEFLRQDVIRSVLENFEVYYKEYEKSGFEAFRERYNSECINIGRELKAIFRDSEIIGVGVGVNDMGELIIREKDGKERTLRSGEVSVRGVY
ncbi:MAG: biotin--[acetyl-CoA-carboxylase] ligase [Clostridiales bacterium]|nr:biotin--[acetyl-CoA-carboxylase] ligase [Clostridiales bacterium]